MIKHELHEILKENTFFSDLPEDDLLVISGCASNVVFKAGEFLAHEGDPASSFYLVRQGKLQLQQLFPGKGPQTVQTIGTGDVVGWSWLLEPHRWAFDVVASEDTRLISLDGTCLRKKCEDNHSLGYRMVKKFAGVLRQRLHATRLQVLDVYGHMGES